VPFWRRYITSAQIKWLYFPTFQVCISLSRHHRDRIHFYTCSPIHRIPVALLGAFPSCAKIGAATPSESKGVAGLSALALRSTLEAEAPSGAGRLDLRPNSFSPALPHLAPPSVQPGDQTDRLPKAGRVQGRSSHLAREKGGCGQARCHRCRDQGAWRWGGSSVALCLVDQGQAERPQHGNWRDCRPCRYNHCSSVQ